MIEWRRPIWAVDAAIALLVLLSWGRLTAAQSAQAGVALAKKGLTIVYSNDVYGEIEPCGCRNNPLGGLVRRSELIKRLSAEGRALVQVDSGDLLFATTPVPPALAEQAELQASYVIRALNEDGLDVAVPGERDFGLGAEVFERLSKQAKFTYLAANLSWKSSRGKQIRRLKPSRVIEREGKRLCFIGLVGKELDWPEGVKVTSPVDAAKAEVAKLSKCDAVVALTHQTSERDVEMVKKVRGIDFVFAGHSASFLQTPLHEGKTWVFESWFRNQYVGALDLTGWDPRAAVAVTAIPEQAHRLTALDPGYEPQAAPSPSPAPSSVQTRTQALVAEFREKLAALVARQEAELRAEAKVRQTAMGAATGKPVFQTFPQCSECHLKQFDFWRKTKHARAFHALFEKGDDRNRECLACHTAGFGHPQGWKEIEKLAVVVAPSPSPLPSQAVAVTGLVSSPVVVENGVDRVALDRFLEALADADGIDSKVEHIGVPGGIAGEAGSNDRVPLRAALNRISRAWTPVQCENCHGPGEDHPFSGKYAKAVSDDVCLKCHTPERAQDWYAGPGATRPKPELLAAKRALVTCPAGDLEEKD